MAFLLFMGWWLFVGVMILWPIYLLVIRPTPRSDRPDPPLGSH